MAKTEKKLTVWERMSKCEFLTLAIKQHAPSDAERGKFDVQHQSESIGGGLTVDRLHILCADIFTMHAVMRYTADALESLRKFGPHREDDLVPDIEFVVDANAFEGAFEEEATAV